MNYEKIIVELLGRIQVLEEQVAMLMNEKPQTLDQETSKISTDDIRHYILELLCKLILSPFTVIKYSNVSSNTKPLLAIYPLNTSS